ncbi:MAG: S1 family peptidase [Anaerolineae bacterium]|nr:S1 family peptidase [Anaerolineae bacterium]
MSINQVFEAQRRFQQSLLAKPNVVGVAVGFKESKGELTDQLAVITLVQEKKPLAALSAEEIIPRELDGIRTDVFEIGFVRALSAVDPKARFRPTIPSGVSIGHFKITAGTLGTIVTDRKTGEKLILSNNHVLANSNDAQVGDPILQPGYSDGGINPDDVIARLERWVKIRFPGDTDPTPPPTPGNGGAGCDVVEFMIAVSNLLATLSGSSKRVSTAAPTQQAADPLATYDNEVDCALARPIDPNQFTGEILNIGQVSGTKPATLGMTVRKMGRTTGFTQSTVNLINATVNVAYGPGTARFTGQIIAGAMSAGGDSGSLIVDGTENKGVGLLFAGSSVSTIMNPIDKVLDALQVNL